MSIGSGPAVDDPHTTGPASESLDASALPIRERGVRSRAGNAMGRTRSALIEGVLRAVAVNGARKTTMADIAASAGIAKGTLYNHFRTKEAVFGAALMASIERLGDEGAKVASEHGPAAGLAHIAGAVGSSPALARLRLEPAAILPLVTVTDDPAWDAARSAVRDVVAAQVDEDPAIDIIVRWIASCVASPYLGDLNAAASMLLARATSSRSSTCAADQPEPAA